VDAGAQEGQRTVGAGGPAALTVASGLPRQSESARPRCPPEAFRISWQTVQTVEELRTAVRGNADKPAILLICREGRNLFVTVRPNA
jgi:hypothetical protein